MLTDILLGATLAVILIAFSLLSAELDEIRQYLERIDEAQRMATEVDDADWDDDPDELDQAA